MADWKVIALVSGNIEAVSGPAAQDRPGAHEWTVWKGPAANKAEALKCAEKADPRVDLEWMRIRYQPPWTSRSRGTESPAIKIGGPSVAARTLRFYWPARAARRHSERADPRGC